MQDLKKIVMAGAGNVATHLGLALKDAGCEILQVYSRTQESASLLANKLNCTFTTRTEDLSMGADLYIFSLSDHALEEIIQAFPHKDAFVVHTSGSIGLDAMGRYFKNCGVFYPLQTFSRDVSLDFGSIPLCLEASDAQHLESLKNLALAISNDVRFISSQQREILHIAAVFACNFTNHLYAIADEILEQEGVDFNILHPLLEETLRKAKQNKPADVQTGPAARNDLPVIQKHLQRLSSLPAYQKIYNFISQSITESQKK